MKKLTAAILAVFMVFTMASCSFAPTNKIEAYVEANRDTLIASMEESFAKSSGMTCTSSIEVDGNGFIIKMNINELEDLDETIKSTMQTTYNSLQSSFDTMLEEMQKELPELEYIEIQVCEKDGDLIAKVRAAE